MLATPIYVSNVTEPMDRKIVLDNLLIDAYQGDAAALGRLLEYFRSDLKRFARHKLGSAFDRRFDDSDVVQQTCLSAIRKFHEFKGQGLSQFVDWLHEIHRNNLGDAIRRHKEAGKRALSKEQGEAENHVGADSPHRDPSPSQHLIAQEQATALQDAVNELPERQKQAVLLRHIECLSLKEIGERLQCGDMAVAGLLKRAMQSLRQHFQVGNERDTRHDG